VSIQKVTMYRVVCDAAGCDVKTGDLGDYSAWGEEQHAVDEWDACDQQVTDDGKHFCDNHRVPTCCECGGSRGVANNDPDDDGDWFCARHRDLADDQP
jgi:hypothetical protein